MKKNIPNILTFMRIALVPLFVICFFLPNPQIGSILAFIVFIIAGTTDWLDGYLARKWKVESDIGKCFDPIADKLLVLVSLYVVVWQEGALLFPAIIIAGREIIVSGLREHLANSNIKLNVTPLAKIKTAVQMAAISIFIILPALPSSMALVIMDGLGIWAMWIAAALTVFTGVDYVVKAFEYFKKSQPSSEN